MHTLGLVIIALGVVTVIALSFYAGRLLRQLKEQKIQQKQKQDEKHTYLKESITVICKAMLEEQCELSEGALRVWVLLDHLYPKREINPETTYVGIFQMYQVVKDMPTHEARKQQEKALTRKQDAMRLKAEVEFKELILADAKALLERVQSA